MFLKSGFPSISFQHVSGTNVFAARHPAGCQPKLVSNRTPAFTVSLRVTDHLSWIYRPVSRSQSWNATGTLEEVEVIGTLYVLTESGMALRTTASIPEVDQAEDFSPPLMYWKPNRKS